MCGAARGLVGRLVWSLSGRRSRGFEEEELAHTHIPQMVQIYKENVFLICSAHASLNNEHVFLIGGVVRVCLVLSACAVTLACESKSVHTIPN